MVPHRMVNVIWIGTGWKMNKTLAEAREYAHTLAKAEPGRWRGVQPFIIPPATALATVRGALGPESRIMLGAQNAHWQDSGPWTGEISVPQVADAGAQIVEIGHSERRLHFGETDETVNLKVRATLRNGLLPLVCVGEPEEVSLSGGAVRYVLDQVRTALTGVEKRGDVLLAYEPIWAIGESGRIPTTTHMAEIFAALTSELGGSVRGVLYGGSVSLDNAVATLGVDGVDGLFIGRSAWNADDFIEILDAVARYVLSVVPSDAPHARPLPDSL